MGGPTSKSKADKVQGDSVEFVPSLNALANFGPAPALWFKRFWIMVPRPVPAAALVVHRRYFAVVPRPMPAAPLGVRRRNLIAASSRCPQRRLLFVAGT